MQIQTARLLLREWRDADAAPFAAINADPAVMRYFPALLTEAESVAMIERMRLSWQERGFGLFCVEQIAEPGCIGFVGLSVPRFEAHFTPCIEIGWRLASANWNRGYATEAAHAVRNWAHRELHIAELVSFTTTANVPSRRVMEKIGLTHDTADDFAHPNVPIGDPLRPHVLYRGTAADCCGRG